MSMVDMVEELVRYDGVEYCVTIYTHDTPVEGEYTWRSASGTFKDMVSVQDSHGFEVRNTTLWQEIYAQVAYDKACQTEEPAKPFTPRWRRARRSLKDLEEAITRGEYDDTDPNTSVLWKGELG